MFRLAVALACFVQCFAALSQNPTGDAIGSVRGLILRLLGPEMLPHFNLTVIDPTPGRDGFAYDTFSIEAAGELA